MHTRGPSTNRFAALRLAGLLASHSGCAGPPPAASVAPVAHQATDPPASATAEDAQSENATAARAGGRLPLQGAPVPRQLLTLSRDYASLTLASPPVSTRGERLRIEEPPDRLAITVSRARVTEVEIGPHRWFLNVPGNPFGYARGLLGTPTHPCEEKAALPARWRGFSPASVTSETLVFTELRGELDPAACGVEARTRLDVRAVALVPRTLYAFRRCEEACAMGWSAGRRETLTLVAPPSEFVLAADATPDDMTNPHVGSFSVVEIPVASERATSATVVLPTAALERLTESERRGVTALGASGLELDVELLGPSSNEAPSLTLHLAALADSAWDRHLRAAPGAPPRVR
jgi:hypothetical protein